jgi:hypothetical protein
MCHIIQNQNRRYRPRSSVCACARVKEELNIYSDSERVDYYSEKWLSRLNRGDSNTPQHTCVLRQLKAV